MSSIENQTKECLLRAGLMSLPEAADDDLEIYGMDSLIKALTVVEIEREFKIQVDPKELDQNPLRTLNDFVRLVNAKRGAS